HLDSHAVFTLFKEELERGIENFLLAATEFTDFARFFVHKVTTGRRIEARYYACSARKCTDHRPNARSGRRIPTHPRPALPQPRGRGPLAQTRQCGGTPLRRREHLPGRARLSRLAESRESPARARQAPTER